MCKICNLNVVGHVSLFLLQVNCHFIHVLSLDQDSSAECHGVSLSATRCTAVSSYVRFHGHGSQTSTLLVVNSTSSEINSEHIRSIPVTTSFSFLQLKLLKCPGCLGCCNHGTHREGVGNNVTRGWESSSGSTYHVWSESGGRSASNRSSPLPVLPEESCRRESFDSSIMLIF